MTRLSRRPVGTELAPYGHPITWPGRIGYLEAITLLGVARGPGYVIGIDQATCSGWAAVELKRRQCVLSGRAKTPAEQKHALLDLEALPGFSWREALVVMEDHRHIPADKGKSVGTLLKLGEARGRWHALLSVFDHPETHRILVQPQRWRRILGTRAHLPRAAWKAQAKLWSSAVCARPITNDDEAEAICIASWGAWDGLAQWARDTVKSLAPPAPKRRLEKRA